MSRTVDGTALYRDAIQKINDLRARALLLERAFTAYVTDDLEKGATERHEKQSPPVLGFCSKCGFPVYRTDIGAPDLCHYTGGRYQSAPITCIQARLTSSL